MNYLCDTNLMWRCLLDQTPDHREIKKSIDRLLHSGHDICITAQNLIEYHGVATRAVESNGLGLSVIDSQRSRLSSV